MTNRIGACVALLALLAGCTAPGADTVAPDKARAQHSAAVVADVSVGTNPYHEIFRRPGWTEPPCKADPGIPCDLPQLNLTLGSDYAADVAADAATWSAYQPGVVYWVPGTNLLLLTLNSPATALCTSGQACPFHDGYTDTGGDHGVWTSGVIASTCPDCYVLVVQDAPAATGAAVEHIAANIPWVDFVASTALSGDGNPTGEAGPVLEKYQQATLDLANSGRLFFAASGDYAAGGLADPSPVYGYDYPPWVVAVGGMTAKNPFPDAVQADCNAIDLLSGTPAEMLTEFTLNLAMASSIDGYYIGRGTSFSAPQLAARFGQALVTVRSQLGDHRAPGALWTGKAKGAGALSDGRLTAEEMRAAFAASARYFSATDFNAACVAEVDQRLAAQMRVPLTLRPVGVPWIDMGWGYVGADETALAAQVIMGAATAPAKPAEADAWMSAFMGARATAFPLP